MQPGTIQVPDRSPSSLPTPLRDDVRTLGNLLGKVIRAARGPAFLDTIENIRALAKEARDQSGEVGWSRLSAALSGLAEEDVVDVARAFNQFLNLANIAEQHHTALRAAAEPARDWQALAGSMDLANALTRISVELVLTAHPTEILRRTLIQKYDAIASELGRRADPRREQRMERLIAEAWYTDEIRRERPTPQDEARWGFAVVENSLWHAVPELLRNVDEALLASGRAPLEPAMMPLRFSSWMGGDRDGNPNVTAAVTAEVVRLARWMAADLYLRDVEGLIGSLSMGACTAELRAAAGAAREPYREVLKALRSRLQATRAWAAGNGPPGDDVMIRAEELLAPLECCYRSLVASGMGTIARGPLLDTLRRAHCFGLHLVGLDVRENAERHRAALDELTRYLQPGEPGYASWGEAERMAFLERELAGRRPLFPRDWPASDATREVIETCRVVASAPAIGEYIISMASAPSDVLAVLLLLREAGLERHVLVVPLFETLDDLDAAAGTLDALLGNAWYRDYVRAGGDRVQVMIGYSDSAKDAGQLAAAWAQYRAQEQLADVARRRAVELTLFHGRGGAIGRGGGPAQQAIASQPPGSLGGRLRVTEQGEMIRFKLGTPAVALDTLNRYLVATLQATVEPPPPPSPAFRAAMDSMAAQSLAAYRHVVRDEPRFVDLFQALTPEQELAELALGSRPTRRRQARDIDSLRAIPWVFAWTQVRLMLPAWLGTEAAITYLETRPEQYRQMLGWPFFRMQTEMLEMILAKADADLVRYYARRLCDPSQQQLVEGLLERLDAVTRGLLTLRGRGELLADDPELAESLMVRNTYLDPLHLLQAELLARLRRTSAGGATPAPVAEALKVTMAGISSGLRNTG